MPLKDIPFKFQSTRPRGTRLLSQSAPSSPFCFNPRVREGRDAAGIPQGKKFLCFNPRVREGRDRVVTHYCLFLRFQSTRPRGTRLPSSSLHIVTMGFQSTRPRGTRRRHLSQHRRPPVSIHASARDATADGVGQVELNLVSIHASARDATMTSFRSASVSVFQSTRPRGTRLAQDAHVFQPVHVSIHASARDATRSGCSCLSACSCFNPRVREGRDPAENRQGLHGGCFNPRVREGRDFRPLRRTTLRLSFNPRVREGRDSHGHAVSAYGNVSIHASARDATGTYVQALVQL